MKFLRRVPGVNVLDMIMSQEMKERGGKGNCLELIEQNVVNYF